MKRTLSRPPADGSAYHSNPAGYFSQSASRSRRYAYQTLRFGIFIALMYAIANAILLGLRRDVEHGLGEYGVPALVAWIVVLTFYAISFTICNGVSEFVASPLKPKSAPLQFSGLASDLAPRSLSRVGQALSVGIKAFLGLGLAASLPFAYQSAGTIVGVNEAHGFGRPIYQIAAIVGAMILNLFALLMIAIKMSNYADRHLRYDADTRQQIDIIQRLREFVDSITEDDIKSPNFEQGRGQPDDADDSSPSTQFAMSR